MTATMSKKPKRSYDNTARREDNIAGECVMCRALLPLANPPRQQNTKVYAKRGNVRYCKCLNCPHTWKRII